MSPSKPGQYCLRCARPCTLSVVTEIPPGESEPVRYEVFTCPTGHGEMGRTKIIEDAPADETSKPQNLQSQQPVEQFGLNEQARGQVGELTVGEQI